MHKHHPFTAALCIALSGPALSAPAPATPVKVAAAPNPEQLGLAARVSAALWPNGTYGRIFQGMMGGENGLFDMVLDMRPADLLGAMAEDAGGKTAKGAPPAKPSPTLRETMRAEDPHFEERMRITAKVAGEELTRIAAPIEPKLRDGLTKSIARRFTAAQLSPIADFFETEAGKAYAAQSMSLFIDKDVILALMSSVPAVIKEMPGAMKKVEKATAHLPKPKRKEPEVAEDSDHDTNSETANEDPPST